MPGPAPVLAGFHGYGEDAEAQMERLCAIPESDRWLKISIQALHPFYERRTNRVVASWMTRQDRERAIADNVVWVSACLEAAAAEWSILPQIVFAGFSQGVAMAFRAAVHSTRPVAGVIAVGGDVPPELASEALAQVGAAFIARGTSDTWYTDQKFAEDQRRLRESVVSVTGLEFDGGHEWSGAVAAGAAEFLRLFTSVPPRR
jgi:predicted esterase